MNTDRRYCWLLITILLIGGALSPAVPKLSAQVEPATPDRQRHEPKEAEVSNTSDGQRLLIIKRVIELDRAKLDEARRELESRESLFDSLSRETQDLALVLEERLEQQERMGEESDSADALALEAEITKLEHHVEVMATQSDLFLTAENTVRKQIEALEKMLEREKRAIDTLRGVAPAEATHAAVEAQTPLVGPEGRVPTNGAKPGGMTKAATRVESTAQIEALREIDRLEAEVALAEMGVVEFVKRKESLQQQIGFEEVLRETAAHSVENLNVALGLYTGLLETRKKAGVGEVELVGVRGGLEKIKELIAETESEIDRRGQYIESLQERLEQTQEEEDTVTQKVEDRREAAKKAYENLYWLESPIHPKNLWSWVSTRGPRMLLVIIVAWVLLVLVRFSARGLARTLVGRTTKEKSRGAKRADTLALSFRSVVSLFIMVAAVLLVFQEAGIDIKTVLGGAAILGVAVAFGAQNLMRDYFTGFMILLEDQYELGDLITVGGITGRVEKVNMRTTVLRDIEGRVHFIPNGEVKLVTNRTYQWGRAVLEIPIGFKEDVDRVMEVILQVAQEFREDPETGGWVTRDPVMLGVDKFTEFGVIIKFMVETQPDKIFSTRRQMLRRIKNRFDREGIEISAPHRVLVQEKGEDVAT